MEERAYTHDAKVMIWAVIDDMRRGQVPLTVESFTGLHDHVDANDYILLVLDYDGSEAHTNQANALSDEVDHWLRHLGDRSSVAAIRAQAPAL